MRENRTKPEIELTDRILRLSSRIARLLDEEIDEGIDAALEEVGRTVGADRAYVVLFDDEDRASTTHAWSAPGSPSEGSAMDALAADVVRRWRPTLQRGEPVRVPRNGESDGDSHGPRAGAAVPPVQSFLWVPATGPDGVFGFVGVDAVRHPRSWDEADGAFLAAAASLVAAALLRRAAAAERDQVQNRLIKVTEALRDIVVMTDARMSVTFVNPSVEAILGIRPHDLLGRPILDLFHEQDRASMAHALDAGLAAVGGHTATARGAHVEGREVWLETTFERLTGGAGTVSGAVFGCREVTRRIVDERAMRREVRYRRAMVEITNEMLAARLDERFYQGVIDRAIDIVPDAEGGSMVVADADGAYRFVAARGFDLDVLRTLRLTGAELARSDPPRVERIFVRRTRGRLPDEKLAAFRRAGRFSDIAVTLSVPIVAAGEPRGFLNLDNFAHEEAFGPDAIEVAGALAAQVGVALHRLTLESRLQEERARFEHQAGHDALTGLPNRRLFHDRLDGALARARRRRHRVALSYLDLNGFKSINDSLGHAAGDAVLREVAARFFAVVRTEDTVARLGGDEFAVVLGDLASGTDAETVARKLIDALTSPVLVGGRSIRVGASLGIALFPDDGSEADELMRAADAAMYRVKSGEGGPFAFASGPSRP